MIQLSPLAIKDVTPHIIQNPKRIDIAVKGFQSSFSELNWLTKSFARAIKQSTIRDNTEYTYPAIFVQSGYDLLDMLQLDNWDAYSFFFARDPETVLEYEFGVRNKFRRVLSAIFWFDLTKIDSVSDPTEVMEEIKTQVLDKIRNTRFEANSDGDTVIDHAVLSIFDVPEVIFDGFSTNLVDDQFLYFQYAGLRIDMECFYFSSC